MKYIKKIIPIIIILFLLLFIKNKVSEIQKLKATGTTVESIQDELEEERERKALLTEQLKHFKSTEYIEFEAREKLNLTKEGEALVIVNTSDDTKKTEVAKEEQKENWQKWLEKLF